jgi:cystathionine beta-lyase
VTVRGVRVGDPGLPELRRRESARWRAYPVDVLPSFVAEMDWELAPPIAAALVEAVARGDTGYAWPTALPVEVAAFAAREWDWQVDPRHVVVLGDIINGITVALRALTGPEDPVVVTPPVYAPFFTTVRDLAERPLVEVPLVGDDGRLVPDLDGLERAFSAGSRTLLLCHPHNPSGVVLTRAELADLAGLCAAYDVLVLSDEVHAPMSHPGTSFVPFPVVAGPSVRSVVLTSASKSWNVPGLKCAFLIAGTPDVARTLQALPHETFAGTGIFGVVAARAAFAEGDPWRQAAVARMATNARLLGDLLAEHLPAVCYRPPDAGYLAWLDCRGLGLGDDPAAAFLQRGRVALSRGPTFGAGGSGFARMTIATSADLLEEAVRRMARASG